MNDKNAGKRNFRCFWRTFSLSCLLACSLSSSHFKLFSTQKDKIYNIICIENFFYRIKIPWCVSQCALAYLNKFYFSLDIILVCDCEQCTRWNGFGWTENENNEKCIFRRMNEMIDVLTIPRKYYISNMGSDPKKRI